MAGAGGEGAGRGEAVEARTLRAQIVALTATGELPVGARLPTVRALARDLGLAPGTVARAYRELERDGNVETRGRHGTFVATTADLSSELRDRQLRHAAEEYAARAVTLGVAPPAAVAAVESAFEQRAADRESAEPVASA